jgi:precorrin-6B methylase 2
MVQCAMNAYEPAKHALIRRRLRPGMTFVDVGANKGDFTLLAARLTGKAGRVISIEPEPEIARS